MNKKLNIIFHTEISIATGKEKTYASVILNNKIARIHIFSKCNNYILKDQTYKTNRVNFNEYGEKCTDIFEFEFNFKHISMAYYYHLRKNAAISCLFAYNL